ncbi:unnamed protein product [Parnassius apollo]|uniref:(apollo) hypothetical protein n=1 Tax=Parnassius apollo TaxID=110799 RepID=A0A8S3W0M3_PARAO|nr:unnamed protein product [Parnassius apollo]
MFSIHNSGKVKWSMTMYWKLLRIAPNQMFQLLENVPSHIFQLLESALSHKFLWLECVPNHMLLLIPRLLRLLVHQRTNERIYFSNKIHCVLVE